ncbi:MAG: DNA alkylation repair protein [Flavobacteriales bacterium]
MAEALKEMFNKAYYLRLADAVQEVMPRFDTETFLRHVTKGLEQRELNARLRHTSETLGRFLPENFPTALEVLREVATRMPKGYTALVYPDFVGLYGLETPAYSLEALKYFTPFGSSEFAVREFLRRDVKGTLKVMRHWTGDADEHVRRLASEGSRPRLPWSFRLDAMVKDPTLTRPILHALREDPALYVRKSVANHMNDVAKDHPELMLDALTAWTTTHPHTAWIAKHACRNLIKQGHPRALALFAFEQDTRVELTGFLLRPKRVKLGERIEFSFMLTSLVDRDQKLVVDYRIHYRKADGRSSAKVFKLKELVLGKHEAVSVSKRQRMQDFSTRKHHAGEHRVEILVNGSVLASDGFLLVL